MIIGRVYKLTSQLTDKIYIGSTIQTLEKRLAYHKYNQFLKNSSYELLKHEDVKIELIEEQEFVDVDALHKLEEYYIKTLNCVNKRKGISGRPPGAKKTDEEKQTRKREYAKKYYQAHKEHMNETCKRSKQKQKELAKIKQAVG